MSHTSSYRTTIRVPAPQLVSHRGNIKGTPCMEILRLAAERLVRERGGSLTEGYHDCRGRLHPCLFGISTPTFPKGIGVTLASDGTVQFEYDRQGVVIAEAEAICRDWSRAYTVIAVLRAQQKLGYHVSVVDEKQTNSGRNVTLRGIKV